jgi:hypothetical protein
MAKNLPPPDSQKLGDRPISFMLDNQSQGAPQAFVDLVIRPEELVRTDPSRLLVTQSLGGAWADSFGPGISQITISGHTGWRRREFDDDDGLARFARLKENVFDRWHDERERNQRQGIDPNQVKLIFSDALDDFSVVVAPMSFTLRRNKSRPLLAMYQISMLVLESDVEQNEPFPAQFGFLGATSPMNALTKQAAGLTSMLGSVSFLSGAIPSIGSFLPSSMAGILGPVQSLMGGSCSVFSAVASAVQAGSGIAGQLIGVASMAAQAGAAVFRTIGAIAQLPQVFQAQIMSVAAAYTNIYCVLRNALNQQQYFFDYSDLYGASNCSSTSGGRPISILADENPFYRVVPTLDPSPISITAPALTAFKQLATCDPVLAPMSLGSLQNAVSSAAGGLLVSL